MTPARFNEITARYASLRIAVVGDFCLDRYLEIDPSKQETSIETGLPVHNVANVRSQPGGAGTIVNNLVALGIGSMFPIGFVGVDGEGFELCEALRALPRVNPSGIFRTKARRTFTYVKPLVIQSGRSPTELNRLDMKNWEPTSQLTQGQLMGAVEKLNQRADALIVLDQVDLPETGVVTSKVLEVIGRIAKSFKRRVIIGDSRRSLRGWPPVMFKMNSRERTGATCSSPSPNAASSAQTRRAKSSTCPPIPCAGRLTWWARATP